jgi:hypothetical protein
MQNYDYTSLRFGATALFYSIACRVSIEKPEEVNMPVIYDIKRK